MNQKLKVGVIGTGYGGLVHVPGFQHINTTEVYGIYGRTKEKAIKLQEKFKIPQVFDSAEDLISCPEIDIVTISTPPLTHFDLVMAALKNKKHILCEKPLMMTSEQAKEVYEFAKAQGVKHAVGHQIRYNPNRKTMKTIIGTGELGNIIHVNLSYSTANRVDPNTGFSWWADESCGGGQLFAMGSHQIDLLHFLFGNVKKVGGSIHTHFKTRQNKDGNAQDVTSDEFCTFQLYFESGVVANVSLSSVAIGWKGPKIQVYGEKGSLFLEDDDILQMVRKTTATHDLSEKDPLYSTDWVCGSAWRGAFARLAENFVNSILHNEDFIGATFEDGLHVQKIMDALKQSSKEGRVISL